MRVRNSFGFLEDDVKSNALVKRLGGLLPKLDPKIEWVDYIPGDALKTGTPLVAIGYVDKVKYVNVCGLSPFKFVNEVMNALDDYCLPVQFLSQKKLNVIQDDLERLALDRTEVTMDALSLLESGVLTPSDCTYVTKMASEMEILPAFFPNEHANAGAKVLCDFLRNSRATFMDTQMLTDMLKEMERKRLRENESKILHSKLHNVLNVNLDISESEPEMDELEL